MYTCVIIKQLYIDVGTPQYPIAEFFQDEFTAPTILSTPWTLSYMLEQGVLFGVASIIMELRVVCSLNNLVNEQTTAN